MRKKIYVADDDLAILEVCTIILEEEGYEVEASPDGRSIENRETDLPHLIFLDVFMSGSNGNEICQALKKHPATKSIPVILLSANRNLNEIGTSCGADAVLPKPFDIDSLVKLAWQYTSGVQTES